MKIIVASNDERALMNQLCDISLKADGLKNLRGVELILNSIVNEPPKPKEEPKKGKEK
jgi:hypothetical protein